MDATKGIISAWSQSNDFKTPERALELTDQLVNILNTIRDGNDVECFLELISNSATCWKLVELLEVTRNVSILTNILIVFKALTVDKKGESCSNLSRTALWLILLERIFESDDLSNGSAVTNECRCAMMDIFVFYFRNKSNCLKACQTVDASTRLVVAMLNLLELRTKANRKTMQKRRKTAASVLNCISQNDEGRKLIINASGLERLYKFVFAAPDDKSYDAVVHKIGQTILRCVPLQDLPGHTNWHSAFVYHPFVPVGDGATGDVPVLYGTSSSDSSEESDCDGEETLTASPPVHIYRSPEELNQYQRHFDSDTTHNDELSRTCSDSIPLYWSRPQIYEYFARKVRAIHGFRLIPYPDWINATSNPQEEKFYVKDRRVCRSKVIKTLTVAVRPDTYKPRLVYDLDALLLEPEAIETINMIDVKSLEEKQADDGVLHFESRFESGNLRRAFQVKENEYDLILNADVNSSSRQQWFYFRLSGSAIRSSVTYTFNIINMEKQRSLSNEGMQPVVLSVRQCLLTGEASWMRSGTSICYYRNNFRRGPNLSYWSLSFDLTFPFDDDVCYIAYHYPLTYAQLMTDLVEYQREFPDKNSFRLTTLCRSPCQNAVPLVSIGSHGNVSSRSISFVSARVHPVESCSSFCMRGLINAAVTSAIVDTSSNSNSNQLIIFVPMLNVDGVIHGCARCELTNEDLNRRWLEPDPFRHPTIYHYKGVVEFICRIVRSTPVVLIDLHGHSRRFNVFLYGCDASQSWNKTERDASSSQTHGQLFLRLLQSELPSLDVDQCNWQVEKSRESTARIVAWRHLAISNSFTLECSLGGTNQRPLQGLLHFNTSSYLNVGKAVYAAIGRL